MGAPNSGVKVRIINKHIHSAETIYPVDITTPYTVSSGAVAGNPGSLITIFAAGTFSEEFDIHYVFGRGLPSTCVFRLRFYIGTVPRFIGETEFIRATNFERGGSNPIITADDHELLNPNEIIQADAICDQAGPIALSFDVGIHDY